MTCNLITRRPVTRVENVAPVHDIDRAESSCDVGGAIGAAIVGMPVFAALSPRGSGLVTAVRRSLQTLLRDTTTTADDILQPAIVGLGASRLARAQRAHTEMSMRKTRASRVIQDSRQGAGSRS